MTTPPKSLEERVRQRREGDDHFDINDCCDEVRQELQALRDRITRMQDRDYDDNTRESKVLDSVLWEIAERMK